ARARSAGDAGARAPEPAREDEIGVLAVEFNRMLDRLAEGEETRRRLLAAVSHELRTPLAVARGHLEVATGAGSAGSAEREELAVTLGAELERLSRIVDDLTALADAGALTTATGPVFVPDVLDALRERIAGLGVAGVEIRAAPPVVVEADEARLGQALMNLVVNAATHTGPSTRVLVEARVDDAGGDHSVCFAVTDDGPGIPEALRERVFEPFVTTRGDGSSPRAGLGLAVVKAFTEAQGGRVELRTGAGGTTVTIRLPAAR
ncbi:MAG: HAMP domain-containing sensor histidine kinase, partial [Acidimicrobiia bacterium]